MNEDEERQDTSLCNDNLEDDLANDPFAEEEQVSQEYISPDQQMNESQPPPQQVQTTTIVKEYEIKVVDSQALQRSSVSYKKSLSLIKESENEYMQSEEEPNISGMRGSIQSANHRRSYEEQRSGLKQFSEYEEQLQNV